MKNFKTKLFLCFLCIFLLPAAVYAETVENDGEVEGFSSKTEEEQVQNVPVGYQFENRTEDGKDIFIQLGLETDQLSELILTYVYDDVEKQVDAVSVIQNVAAFHVESEASLISVSGQINGVPFVTQLQQLDQSEGEIVETDNSKAADDGENLDLYVAENPEDNGNVIVEAAANTEAVLAAVPGLLSTGSSEKIVVIDPGHSSVSTGASKTWNGVLYREEILTMKISRYLKSELEKYNNVKVYLTRDENGNPSLYDRVKYASDTNADILVSVHLNAAGEHESNTSATGVEAMVAKIGTYNPSNAQEGQSLARSILNELIALGFQDRGFVFKMGDSTYSDGSTADYYGIVRYGQQLNVPSIIVEHGFINNQSDYERFFSTEGGLQSLAIADAKGIASYLGLTQSETVGDGWHTDESGRKYYVSNGRRLTGWQTISGQTFYFAQDGYVTTGTPLIDGKKYWFDENGVQRTGWLDFYGMKLYFDSLNNGAAAVGYMEINSKSYVFDGNGVLYTGTGTPSVNGKKYWVVNGEVKTGWLSIAGMKLYFDPQNMKAAAVGTPVIDGKKYWFDAEGIQKTGWLVLGSMSLYFDPDNGGAAATGYLKVDSVSRVFDANGVMYAGTGTPVVNGKKFWVQNGISLSGWMTMGNMRLYFDPKDQNSAAVGLRTIEGVVYNFDSNGIQQSLSEGMMVTDGKKYLVSGGKIYTGWLQLTADWRLYFDPKDNGAAATGFREINSIKYYFDSNGIMYRSVMPVIDGKKYYILDSGRVFTGWLDLTANWRLYMNPDDNGAAAVGFTTIGTKKYYFDANGIMSASGMPIINNKKYMVQNDGSLYMGWLQLTPDWRLYMNPNDNGAAAIGFNTIQDARYYFDENGIMAVGFKKINGDTYYFDKTGSMQLGGTPIIDGNKYAFDSEGKQIFGWYQLGSFRLYLDPDNNGAAVTTYIQIDNVLYQFNSDGVLISSEVQSVTLKDPINGRTYALEPQCITDPQIGTDVTEAEFLASVLYTEAGNQGFAGQIAVAMVILNRMESESFPASLKFVIYAKTQFEVARDGSLTKYLTAFKDNDVQTLRWIENARSLEAAHEAIRIMDEYKKGTGKKVIDGITLPDNVENFDYLFFMTPAAFTRLNIDPVASNSMTYNGHVFFEKWKTK